ncbi:MAG: hypothetical protein Q3994_07505, partial [Prevotella sp.]|nr:hypothetical protein [Prevotella sp.]
KTGIIDEFLNLKPVDKNYIIRKYTSIKKTQYQEIISGTEKNDLMTFCKKIAFVVCSVREKSKVLWQNLAKRIFVFISLHRQTATNFKNRYYGLERLQTGII